MITHRFYRIFLRCGTNDFKTNSNGRQDSPFCFSCQSPQSWSCLNGSVIKSLSYRDDWIYSATDSQTALLTGVRANSHKRHLTRAISLYDRHTRIVRIFQSKQRILNRFIAGKTTMARAVCGFFSHNHFSF